MDSRIHIHVYSLVFPSLARDLHVESGASISDMLLHIGLPASSAPYLRVSLEGFALPEAQWRRVRPKAGTHIQVGVMPASDASGPNKDALRMAGVIASIVGGYLVPTALGLSGVGQAILQGALTYGGYWLTTTLIPYQNTLPPSTAALNGGRNQARQFGTIPTVHGRMRIVPPLAVAPETELKGEDHYIQLLLCLGYKPLNVDLASLKIGETPLSEFQGVTTELNDGWNHFDPITMFSGDINEEYMDRLVGYAEEWRVDLSGSPIDAASTAESRLAPGVVKLTTPSNTARINIDLSFPNGLGRKGSETISEHQVAIQLQYRPAGSTIESAWVSHIPTGEEVAQVVYDVLDQLSRSACITWLSQLTSLIGDAIDSANTIALVSRNVPLAIYETVYNAATALKTQVDARPYGMNYIVGEEAAMASLKFQSGRILDLCKTVLDVLDEEDLTYSKEFLTSFSKLSDAAIVSDQVLAIRQAMGNGDTLLHATWSEQLRRFVSMSQQFPTVFQSIPTEYFEVKPIDARGGVARRNIAFTVPEGKWEVRLRKTTPDHPDDDTYLEEVRVTTFRCHRVAPTISDEMRSRLALLAVEVLATDQLTGSLDQLSIEVERPVYFTTDGVNWQGPALTDADGNRVSRNPAWIMADILTQFPATKPVGYSRIDSTNLRAFADFCDNNNLHFDRVFDQRGTVHRALQEVCAAAKGAPTIRDGKYAVIWDRPQSVARAVISIANATGFESGKAFQLRPQALRIRFKNPAKDWVDDEIHVFDDGFGENGRLVYHNEVARAGSPGALSMSALYEDVTRIFDVGNQVDLDIANYRIGMNTIGTRTVIIPRSSTYNFREGGNYAVIGHVVTRIPNRVEEVSIPGLVDVPNDSTHEYHSNQVYKLGRYLLAVAKLRPEIFKARLDFEHLVFERGDRVEVQMDTVLWGLGASRIRSLTRVPTGPNAGKVATITVEQDLLLEDGDTYAVRIRNSANGISGETTFDYDSAEPATITLEIPFNDSAVPLIKGDLVTWGAPSKSTISCLVKEIRPQRDLSAEVTLVQYSPGVFEAENGPIPEFDPGITIPPRPELQRPPAPAIIKVTTDESVLDRDTDGSYASRIVIDLRLPQGSTRAERDAASRVDAIHVQFRRALSEPSKYKPEWIRSGVYARDVTRVSIRDVEDGHSYDVRIRAVTREGIPSIWSERQNVYVEGKLTPPPDVENLRWLDEKIVWEYPSPPFDHAGYIVRYTQGKGAGWNDAVPAHSGRILVTEFPTEISYETDRAYLVKAVDTSGIVSRNAKVVTRARAHLPGSFEHTRISATLSGDAWTEDSGTYELNAFPGSQALLAFFKGRGDDPFYAEPGAPFYQRTYGPLDLPFAAGSWSGPTPAGPTARWRPEIKVLQAPPYVIEGFAENIPLWPEDLDDPIWPADLSENFWPEYMAYEPLRPEGVPHIADVAAPDGVTAWFRIRIPASNMQTKVTGMAAMLTVPLRTERIHDFACTTTTPGTGDIIPLQGEFSNIVSAQATLQADEAGGSVRIVKTGNEIEIFIYDAAGARAEGIVDVTVEGY